MDVLTSLQIFFYRAIAATPLLLVFALGAAIGSFLNVVIYRLPAGLSLVHPPSRCPHCGHQLGPTENIPIWGWIRLKGRCKSCRAPISPRYPLVELATALLFVLVFSSFGQIPTVVAYWTLFSWLLVLSLIDFDTQVLPNPLTQSGLVLGLVFQAVLGGWAIAAVPESLGPGAVQGVVQGVIQGAVQGLMGGVIGAVLGIWLLGAIRFLGSIALGQAAMGGGDVKLAAMMGAWLGWKLLLLSLFLAALVGAVVGSGGLFLGLIQRQQRIPFGPFLALGAALSALWGDRLITLYQSWFWTL
jgi:leader peptidase (prepilin peptidase) / N-methyltransferase